MSVYPSLFLSTVWLLAFMNEALAENYCEGLPQLSSPLSGILKVTSPFSKDGLEGRPHLGVDYQCKNADVMAVADGEIVSISLNTKNLDSPDKRTALLKRGYGLYVVIRHDVGAESLYAHLANGSTDKLKPGQRVRSGDVIGRSDSTGGVTGHHLHFELAPHGNILKPDRKVDPDPCIERTGEITVFSNLRLQGGAFRLSLNGKEIGRTSMGDRATLAISSRPQKTHKLVLEAMEIQLGSEAGFGIELSDAFIFVNRDGHEVGHGQYGEIRKNHPLEFLFRLAP